MDDIYEVFRKIPQRMDEVEEVNIREECLKNFSS